MFGFERLEIGTKSCNAGIELATCAQKESCIEGIDPAPLAHTEQFSMPRNVEELKVFFVQAAQNSDTR